MRRAIGRARRYVRGSVINVCKTLICVPSGVFSVEGSEDIAEKGKRYGIIRSTEVTKAGNRTGESEDKTEEEDAVSVLWLCTTRYLEAIIEPDCDRSKPDDKEE